MSPSMLQVMFAVHVRYMVGGPSGDARIYIMPGLAVNTHIAAPYQPFRSLPPILTPAFIDNASFRQAQAPSQDRVDCQQSSQHYIRYGR